MLLFLPVLILLIARCSAQKNNVCNTYLGYASMDTSPNCSYNPDLELDAEGMIRDNGYGFENHQVITEDGYILNIFRVISNATNKPNSGVIFCHHGIGTDAGYFVAWRDKSLAFQLADLGYDVWLGNARGTRYSTEHINKTLTQEEFYNFSFHEMGIYDTPATLEMIKNVTGDTKGILYLGFSMGTTISYIYSILRAEHANVHLRAIVSLAPMAYLRHVTSSLVLLVPIRTIIAAALQIQNTNVLNEGLWYNKLLNKFCPSYPNILICAQKLMGVVGADWDQLLPQNAIILNHLYSVTSVKAIYHYAQMVAANGRFQQFDYGDDNVVIYGSKTPPVYDVSKISLPVHMYFGWSDALAAPQDVQYLYSQLNTTKYITGLSNGKVKFNHFDFADAKDVDTVFHPYLYRTISDIFS